ncbi:MAG: glycerophosphodiester phosphodiesterase [Desulfovibrio sp.]
MSLSLINDRPLIWGHRGVRSLKAENTLGAIRKAHEVGADGVEIDVQLTKDGTVILLHDLNLLRTTNARVHPHFVSNPPSVPWNFTLDEIKQLNAHVYSRRWSCSPTIEESFGQIPESVDGDNQIPTLSEALQLCSELGLVVNVEIKNISHCASNPFAKAIVPKVLGIIAAENMDDRVLISSFHHEYIKECKGYSPHVPTAALTPHTYATNEEDAMMVVEMLGKLKADAWHPGHKYLKETAVKAVREAGFAINPYTVNDLSVGEILRGWGATGIVTDYPQDLKRLND